MSKKEEKNSENLPVNNDSPGESIANPTGAARRRLLRTLGGSSSVALGALMTSQWQKPVIEAVVLPAHAQTSIETPVGSCPITVTITSYFASHALPYTLSVYVSSAGGVPTVMNQLITTGSYNYTSMSGSSTFPVGSYFAGISIQHFTSSPPVTSYFTASYDASCCTAVLPGQTVPTMNTESFAQDHALSIPDDGQCSFAG